METNTVAETIAIIETKLDSISFEYLESFFNDKTNDFSIESVRDFIEPFLLEYFSSDVINNFISSLSSTTPDVNPSSKLSEEFRIADRIGSDRTEIRSKTQKSLVNMKKLRNQERKIEEKRKKLQGGGHIIAEWNPTQTPVMIVNQSVKSIATGSKDIHILDFDIQFAGNLILQNCDLHLAYGRRYGLVGQNGIGKSTLLRAISKRELSIQTNIKILHVEQEIHGDDIIALDSVINADLERLELLEKEKELLSILNSSFKSVQETNQASNDLKNVYQKLQDIDADSATARASAILVGLGFSAELQLNPTKTFSGGWRMRLALARALFCRPDLLLADEVTNHLDFHSIVWLENYLSNWKSTLLVVSHDKAFLDAVTTDILHMHNYKLDTYKGSFSYFISTKQERARAILREYESQKAYRDHLQDFIDRWRYNAKRAPQAQSKIKILQKLPPLIAPSIELKGMGEGEDNLLFRFETPEKLSPPILQLDDITFGYTKSKLILKNVSFDLQMDSKIAIVGPNGAGKSTLIYMLTGEYQPLEGLCHRHGRLRLGIFSQHHVDQLQLGVSAVKFLASKYPGMVEEEYRKILGKFGLSGMTTLQPIGTLSGGQKSRVVFAAISMSNPHVLILDEPSNHLDMDSIDALAAALREFKGGVAIVSHDQQFLDKVCTEVWVCNNASLSKYEPNDPNGLIVYQYKKSLLKTI